MLRYVYLSLLCCPLSLLGQDPFEIHVYEFETLKPLQFTLEQHFNYVGEGNHQLHLTHELTAGVTDQFSLGFMLLAGRMPGSNLEYAGWRVLPHFYAPESWHLPLKLGLVTEFSFQKTAFEENSRRVEIRPILEKSFSRLQLDLNPVFERALHGPGVHGGWNFEPAARAGYEVNPHFTPSFEYYAELGPLPDFLPLREQVHLMLPGADFRFGDKLTWSVGVGIGATSAGEKLVYKSRLEFKFGRD